MATITSDVLNYVIYRYFQGSEFSNTAFMFYHEVGIDKIQIQEHLVPPTTFFKLVHKGLQYIEMEANNVGDLMAGNDSEDPFTFMDAMDLITKNVNELQKIVKEKKKALKKTSGKKIIIRLKLKSALKKKNTQKEEGQSSAMEIDEDGDKPGKFPEGQIPRGRRQMRTLRIPRKRVTWNLEPLRKGGKR